MRPRGVKQPPCLQLQAIQAGFLDACLENRFQRMQWKLAFDVPKHVPLCIDRQVNGWLVFDVVTLNETNLRLGGDLRFELV